jgi:hypothetical protein
MGLSCSAENEKSQIPPTPTEHTSVRKESGYDSQEKTGAAIVDPATVTEPKIGRKTPTLSDRSSSG